MTIEELENLFREYVETLSEEKESFWVSDKDIAEADIYRFLRWIKEQKNAD